MKRFVSGLLAAGLVAAAQRPLSPAGFAPAGLPAGWVAVPLGSVRLTHYTHHECGSRLTASGHVLQDEDEGRVCAVSRDWWRGRVRPGDLLWVPGHAEPCRALDAMAPANRKGFPQRRWLDIYHTDRQKALDFGIQRGQAYLLVPSAA